MRVCVDFCYAAVSPSVCHVRAPNSKTKRRIKTKIGVNVPQGMRACN